LLKKIFALLQTIKVCYLVEKSELHIIIGFLLWLFLFPSLAAAAAPTPAPTLMRRSFVSTHLRALEKTKGHNGSTSTLAAL
jgi:hypothetical protein